jgi:beta-phosphoglucomutase
MLKAVIFDFDGVIADSELLHYKAINQIVARFGVDIPREKYWEHYLGYTDIDCFKAISDHYDLDLGDKVLSDLVDEKFTIFKELVCSGTAIIAGVTDFIKMLVDNEIPVAICSGAVAADIGLMLQDSELKKVFDIIISADDIEKGKPDPEGFTKALQVLNRSRQDQIAADQCLVIEDSHWGLQAARAAGMKSVAVTNTYPKEKLQDHADYVTDKLDSLTIEDVQKICTG